MPLVLPQEVFLSHSSQDGPFASDLAALMRRHGIPVWYSQTNIVGAQQWQAEIGAALQRCDWFAIVLSPQSVNSMWVKRELSFALQEPRCDNKIVPVLYQPCDFLSLSWVLSTFQQVNFTVPFDEGSRNLLRIWGIGYQPLPT
jgi:hypothetical protein